MNYLFVLIWLSAWSCRKDELINTNDPLHNADVIDTLPLQINWQKSFTNDTMEAVCMNPVVYEGDVIVSGYNYILNSNSKLQRLNGETGNPVWIWDNDIADGGNQIFGGPYISYLFQDKFSCIAGDNIMDIDANTGITRWGTNPPLGMYELNGWNNLIFQSYTSSELDWESCSLMKADINATESKWDTVFTLYKTDGFMPSIPPVKFEINGGGDTIIYYQNRQYNFATYTGKIDLYAYNLNKDSILWSAMNIEIDGNSAIYAPVVNGENLYFKGSRFVFCYDKNTGNLIWKRSFALDDEDLIYCNLLIVDDKLIVKTSGKSIYALDLESGSIIWENQDAGATPSDITFFNNVIYYGSGADGKLHAIDSNTGEQLWAFSSPNEQAFGNNPGFYYAVAVDPVNYRLYAPDGYFLICFQLEH